MTDDPNEKILYAEEGYRIQGAAFEVYREKGCGFLEPVYQECLYKEMRMQGVPFVAQPPVKLDYKGESLEQIYRPDFIAFEKIVLELKAVKAILPEHRAQAFNYLKATGLRLAIILNFGHFPKMEIERIVL